MKPILRTYLAITLSLILVLTGQSMAVARGKPDPSGQMVICTGTGPVMISVDARGNPAGPTHICPDAALSLIQADFAASPMAEPRIANTICYRATIRVDQEGTLVAAQQARGPPALT